MLGLKSVTVAAPYQEPNIPESDPKATGIDQLMQISVLQPLVMMMMHSTNPQTIEGNNKKGLCHYYWYNLASIGIVQNLTADYYVTSAYLRAHFRKEKGLPILVEKITDSSPTISQTSIIALRNLAVDLKNKDLIGKYGMKEVCTHIPGSHSDSKQVRVVLNVLLSWFWITHFRLTKNQPWHHFFWQKHSLNIMLKMLDSSLSIKV